MLQPDNQYIRAYPFLKGGGEMGKRIRDYDWTATTLGHPDAWPQSLLITLGILLNSQFPMFLWWGGNLIQFYNNAYRPSLGEGGKHPSLLGKQGAESWPEVWPVLHPMIDEIMTGGVPTWNEDRMIPMFRNGRMEDIYWTYSHSPVFGDDGEIAGVLAVCTETTATVLAIEELRKANDQLRESERRFRIMAEGTDILIAVGDEKGEAVYFNQAWMTFTGRSEAEMTKYGWADMMHPDDKEEVLKIFTAALQAREAWTFEFRMPDTEGNYHWMLARGTPRFHDDGSFAGYISPSVDITDRKAWELSIQETAEEFQSLNEELAATNEELSSANEELTASNEEMLIVQHELHMLSIEKQLAMERLQVNEQNIRNMVRQAPVGMCILEGDPLYVKEVNEAFLTLIGKSRLELSIKPYWEVNAEAADTYKPITDWVMATGNSYYAKEHAILLVRQGSPEMVHVNFVYEPMKNTEGKVFAIMIVAFDVTSQAIARKKIELAEEGLRMAIDAAEMGSFSLDITDQSLVVSNRLKHIYGFEDGDEVCRADFAALVHPDFRLAVTAMIQAAVTQGIPFKMDYPIRRHNDQQERWITGMGTRQQDAAGKTVFVGVVHDVTEQKKDDQRKSDFIGMVSHELKTPLTSLHAYIQILFSRAKKEEDSFAAGMLERANNQAKRMTSMINGFLNISRLESGKIYIDAEKFDMADLVRESEQESIATISSHQVIYAPVESVMVKADKEKIGQVITNLISNAVKYSKSGLVIKVSCILDHDSVKVSVKDQGMGIPTKDLDKVFDRYYRVERQDMGSIAGFGIGLYLCAEIISRHNGKIWAESAAGEGSTFSFTIPL